MLTQDIAAGPGLKFHSMFVDAQSNLME
jgi:hypothetical protein